MADREENPEAKTECTACRGTGKLISALGGEPQSVECPWCEGTGLRQAEHDAQARWQGDATG